MRSDLARPDPDLRDARRRRAETLAAWKHFITGDDELAAATLPPAILLSWRRCRDVHELDPVHPSGRVHRQRRPVAPRYGGVYAQLGAVAAALVHDVGGCLATVTDADAQILASWCARGFGEAADGRFEPQAQWPESVRGTNGMGTALLYTQPIAVRGPEHWRQDMHGWYCLGLAVHDPVTGRPVGAVNIGAHAEDRVVGVAARLTAEVEAARRTLRRRALRDAMAVAERFSSEESQRSGYVIGIDLAGSVIAASEKVRKVVDGMPAGFLLEPMSRRAATFAPLRDVAENSFEKALADPGWTGTAVIGSPLTAEPRAYAVTPVTGPTGLAGWVLSDRETGPRDSGSVWDGLERPSARDAPDRIAALAGDSVLLLAPNEIRFAEANRHVVWLMTDCGRLRAVTKGMDNLERELRRYGFIRVHRSFLINPWRVRRVVHKGSGLIALSTDEDRTESIPVSRRSTHEVRQRLGI